MILQWFAVILLAFCCLANVDCNSYVIFIVFVPIKRVFDALKAI